MSFSEVGKVWDEASFSEHVAGLDLTWARGITMHHTAAPSLDQRPQGFTIQHIRNIQGFYQSRYGWSRGPHLFIDDDQIFGMSPMTERGIHAVSFNAEFIGIEILGNYDVEDPHTGRGLACWETAAKAVAILQRHHPHLKAINGHRDDPKTSKSCPGSKLDMTWFRAKVAKELTNQPEDRAEEEERDEETPDPKAEEVIAAIESIEWQLGKIKRQFDG